jgi:hypothetical protein
MSITSNAAHQVTRIRPRPARTTELVFMFDPSETDRYQRLFGVVNAAPDAAKREVAQAELDEFLQGVEVIRFRLRSVGARRLKELLAAHPPTDERLRYNVDTFPPALIAESTVSYEQPGSDPILNVTAEDLVELFGDGWSDADLALLTSSCEMLASGSTAIVAAPPSGSATSSG